MKCSVSSCKSIKFAFRFRNIALKPGQDIIEEQIVEVGHPLKKVKISGRKQLEENHKKWQQNILFT